MNNQLKQELILKKLWDTFSQGLEKKEIKKNVTNEILIDEFFFISLGGYGISYEQNLSGLEVLKEKKLLNKDLYSNTSNLEINREKLKKEFSTKQFKPITNCGDLRKYRFIETKSKTIVLAGNWLWNQCQWDILGKLKEMDEQSARSWLCKCPGIGLKSASWFLRNIGFNQNYAVLDVHILRFLKKIGFEMPNNLTEKSYVDLEDKLKNICINIEVSMGEMDYLLWILGRNGYLDYVR